MCWIGCPHRSPATEANDHERVVLSKIISIIFAKTIKEKRAIIAVSHIYHNSCTRYLSISTSQVYNPLIYHESIKNGY